MYAYILVSKLIDNEIIVVYHETHVHPISRYSHPLPNHRIRLPAINIKCESVFYSRVWTWLTKNVVPKLSHEVPRDFSRSRRPFQMTPPYPWTSYGIVYKQKKNLHGNRSNSSFNIVTADGLTPNDARPSTGAVVTKFGSCIYRHL